MDDQDGSTAKVLPLQRRRALQVLAGGSIAPVLPTIGTATPPPVSATPASYNPVWTSQSTRSLDSMPCGGGDIGLNVWVEGGDILVYVSRSGAFDETNAYLKLGRLRLTLTPNPFTPAAPFRQELKLGQGHVEIAGGEPGAEVLVTIWVDVHAPVVHAEVAGDRPTVLTAAYESWRTADRPYTPAESSMHRSYDDAPVTPIAYADTTAFAGRDVLSYHRNRSGETAFDMVVHQQELDTVKDRMWNPLAGLTFGLMLRGRGMSPAGTVQGRYASTGFTGWRLRSDRPRRRHDVRAYCHIATVASHADWQRGLDAIVATDAAQGGAARRRTLAWWAEFWKRSWIRVNPGADARDVGWRIGRNYQVFRYQLGTNAYGAYPTKFNGGNFTTDPEYVDPAEALSPDFRRWSGGVFTAQNQRLVYWPMLKSGDFDMMDAQFGFYERARGNAELRTQVYWQHAGASFTEQMESFGLPCAFEYGWHRSWNTVGGADKGIQDSAYVDHLWETSLEFCLMILDVERYTGRDIARWMPLVESCLVFFDEHYRAQTRLMRGTELDADGHLVFFPGTSLETYKNTLNSVVTIAALKTVIGRVLALPSHYLSDARRAYFRAYLERIPPLPMRTMADHRTIAPAETFDRIQNVEIPQLYPVFPYDQYGLGRPDLQVAIDTWRYGVETPAQKNFISWHQDAIFCARLGLTDEAKAITIRKLDDSGRRMTTFWGPGHDWVPDHNWGGSGMIGLQEMLLQAVDDTIRVFPAWPQEWDVDFRLHAPRETIVEGSLRGGRIVKLTTDPPAPERIVLPDWAT